MAVVELVARINTLLRELPRRRAAHRLAHDAKVLNLRDVGLNVIVEHVKARHDAAGLSDDDGSSAHVPRLDTGLKVHVKPTHRDGAHVHCRRAVRADAVHAVVDGELAVDVEEGLDRLGGAVVGGVGADERAVHLGAAGDVDAAAVAVAASAGGGGEDLVGARAVDDAKDGDLVQGEANGDAAVEAAVDEGGGAVDRVDDPRGAVVQRHIVAGLLAEDVEDYGGGISTASVELLLALGVGPLLRRVGAGEPQRALLVDLGEDNLLALLIVLRDEVR